MEIFLNQIDQRQKTLVFCATPPLPAKLSALSDQKLTLGDAWLEVFQQVLPRNQFCAAGKLVARAYREEFGEEPPRRKQFVDGAPPQVKSYRRSWGCTQGRGPLQWHLENVEATITGWSRRHLQH